MSVILLYHRVAQRPRDPFELCTWPGVFVRQLDWLHKHAEVLPLSELPRHGRHANSVFITFDDGYADNLHTAARALVERGLPASFFVTTQPVEKSELFWWDALAEQALPRPRAAFSAYRDDITPREQAFLQAHLRIKQGGRGRPRRQVSGRHPDRPLTQTEVHQLAAQPGLTVGAHSHSHPLFAGLTPEAVRRELHRGRRLLERWTSTPIDMVAYPFGRLREVPQQVWHLAGDLGFRIGLTTEPGRVEDSPSLLGLPRLVVPRLVGRAFAHWLAPYLR